MHIIIKYLCNNSLISSPWYIGWKVYCDCCFDCTPWIPTSCMWFLFVGPVVLYSGHRYTDLGGKNL